MTSGKGDEFDAAMDELGAAAPEPRQLSRPFVRVFPVSGAAVSTIGAFLGSETISASDSTAARLDEMQFDLSEGPCWDAMRTIRPVLISDLREHGSARWPAFSTAVLAEGIHSIFAFPLAVGSLQIGSVDLYSLSRMKLDHVQTQQASAMAGEVGKQVLRNALSALSLDEELPVNAFSRRLVHQATGMVLAQLDITADDARLVIQGHAFAAGRPMMEIARDIVEGRLNFTRQATGIESSD